MDGRKSVTPGKRVLVPGSWVATSCVLLFIAGNVPNPKEVDGLFPLNLLTDPAGRNFPFSSRGKFAARNFPLATLAALFGLLTFFLVFLLFFAGALVLLVIKIRTPQFLQVICCLLAGIRLFVTRVQGTELSLVTDSPESRRVAALL